MKYCAHPEDDEDGQIKEVHVYPLFGPEHDMSMDCWCHPHRDEGNYKLIVHNVMQ